MSILVPSEKYIPHSTHMGFEKHPHSYLGGENSII